MSGPLPTRALDGRAPKSAGFGADHTKENRMSAPGESDRTPPAKPVPKAKVSPVRNIVGLVLLIALVVVAFVEFQAVQQAKAACQKVNKRLEAEESDLPTQKEIETMIGRKPDGPGTTEGDQVTLQYTWRGIFRKHTMTAVYRKTTDLYLLNVNCK
jgi:hypothetical protein